MAPMPSHLSLKLNSKPLLKTLPWIILGLFLPLLPPSDYFMLPIKILRNDVFHALAGLNTREIYGPDVVPPSVLRNCASVIAPCLVKHLHLCLSTSERVRQFTSATLLLFIQESKFTSHSQMLHTQQFTSI